MTMARVGTATRFVDEFQKARHDHDEVAGLKSGLVRGEEASDRGSDRMRGYWELSFGVPPSEGTSRNTDIIFGTRPNYLVN